MKRFPQLSLAVLMLSMGTATWAEPAAEDLIAYRKAVMSALGAHVGALSMMVRGKVSYEHMADQADALASTAAVIGDVFPQGSAQGDTAALAVIWEQEEDFKAKVATARDASLKLVAAVEQGDRAAIGRAFGAMGGACKAN